MTRALLLVVVLAWSGIGEAHAGDSKPVAYEKCETAKNTTIGPSWYPGSEGRCVDQPGVPPAGSFRCQFSGAATGGGWADCPGGAGGAYFPYDSGCPVGSAWDSTTNECATQCEVGEVPDPANPGQCLDTSDCLSRNSSLTTEPVVKGFTSKCVAGCTLKTQGASVGVDGLFTGVYQYSGDVCVKPPEEPETPQEEAEEEKNEQCRQNGTFMQCVRNDGTQCLSASNGKAFCWKPTETGSKTDADAMQKRDAGNQAIPPNAQLPSGDTLIQQGDPLTSTTTTTDANGNTRTSTSTTTNYGTQYGTNAGTTHQGTTNTGAATGGGFSGSGGDDGDDDDKGSVSGGGDCDSPPQVSGGDPLLANIILQTWGTKCAQQDSNAVTSTGEIGDCNSPFSVTGPAGDANVIKLRAARKDICPMEGETASTFETDGEPESIWQEGTGESLLAKLESTPFMGGGSCPALPALNLGAFGTFVPDVPYWCEVVAALANLIMFCAAIAAIRILMGD